MKRLDGIPARSTTWNAPSRKATPATAVCLNGLESSRVGCRDLTIEVDPVSRELKDQAVAALALLGGPSIPVLALEEDFATRVQLVPGAFFVEIELDWREGACFGFVGPSDGSRVPDGYYLTASGRPIREHLALALTRGGFYELACQLREVTRASGASAMRIQIEAIEAALREVWDVLPALASGPHSGKQS